MAVTVLIRQDNEVEHTLSLDAPRIVIGRGKSCDIQLPDPSVSPRHASIRHQGGRHLVIDEGSTNGVVVMSPGDHASALVRLPPRTPRALAEGDFVRIGRIWLEVSFGAVVPSTAPQLKAVAEAVLRDALQRDEEAVVARLEVAGETVLELFDSSREHVIGRAKDAACVLTDTLASRRHAVVLRSGSQWQVRDLGSTRGTMLNGERVGREPVDLAPGATITIGTTDLSFCDPTANAMKEMRAAADVKLPIEALPRTPPGFEAAAEVVDAPTEGVGDAEAEELPWDDDEEEEEMSALDRLAAEPAGAGFAAVDAFVVLIALGMLGVSVMGLAYVLG